MSTVRTLLERIRHLGESSGRDASALLETLAVTRHTFEKNYNELEAFLTALENDPRRTRSIARRSPDVCEDVLNETARLLHNCVAAATTLVAHTRNVWRRLFKESGEFPEFQERIDAEFNGDPLTSFVQRLRAYCLHCRPIDPGITFKRVRGTGHMSRTVSLRVKDLAEWDDWTAPARTFLEHSGKELPLLSTISRYRDKVASFTDWVEERTRELRRSELLDHETRLRAFHLAELEDLMQRGDLQQGAPLDEHEDMLYAGVLTSGELRELAATEPIPGVRVDAALTLLRQHVTVPESFSARLQQWYERACAAAAHK